MQENNIFNIGNNNLDENQISSIINNYRNNLVVASAGSGKTTTIVGKVKYLINIKNVNPSEILCLSFTNKSAKELKEKIEKETLKEMDVFTFHKLGINIINNYSNTKKEYLTNNTYVIINIIKDHLKIKAFFNNYLDYFYYSYKNKYYEFKKEYYKIVENGEVIASYISAIKQEKLNINKLLKKSNNKKYILFVKILIPIYNSYEEYIAKNNLIDFNDMINIAYHLIKDSKVVLPYKYIIIDEYQDMSLSRYLLIKEIYDKNNTEIFCVGDDYQCIFSYAGSNLDFFINFDKYFGKYQVTFINKTYRFNQMLASISSKFISKNRKQFKKIVNSFKENNIKSIKIINLEELNNVLLSLPSYSKVYFLGRYKKDLNIVEGLNIFNIEKKLNETIIYFKRKIDLDINFFTVHQSKGLEADYIFLLNNKKGKNGFPSEKEDNNIQKILFKRKYFLEEERRLYYVAITRCKVQTLLINDKDNESIFIKEIKKSLKKYK